MAKPFKFRLERVLDYRRQLADEAVAALAKAQAEHDAQKELADGISHRLEEHRQKGIKKEGGADDVWLFRQYETGLEQDLNVIRETLAKLALNLQKCRQVAVERSKDKKLLETLKEKESKRYHYEANRQEQKEFDEQSVLRGTKEHY